jgi:hypothetical protein
MASTTRDFELLLAVAPEHQTTVYDDLVDKEMSMGLSMKLPRCSLLG